MHTRDMKTALIVGGASGMGRAVALALSARGISILAADLDGAGVRETTDLIRKAGSSAEGFEVDISSGPSVAGLFDRLKERTERLDLLVNTAGVMGETAPIEQVSDESWRRLLAVNLDGAFYCCRETVRWMKETGGGRIVLFSSVASLTPTPGAIGYSAAKGGVNMLAKTLAVETAKYNIRVNVIAPGYIETPMLEGLPEGFESYIIRKTPVKRLGDTEEIAGLVAFLASREADFFTGQVLSPNGGLVI